MDVRRALIFVTFGTLAGAAQAQPVTEIFKCQEANGRFTYTNDKRETTGKKCEVVASQINVAPSPAPAKSAPAPGAKGGSPRETPADRLAARGRQREILESELKSEEAALAKAKAALAEQEAVRTGDERNYARVEERLRPFKETVDLHEKNVNALRREIANLSR